MLAALDRLGEDYGVARQLSWEAYMRCGIGICGSCEHDGRVLCLDGPVLQHGGQIASKGNLSGEGKPGLL
jgi:dihydroorotate dehydrogenase electron transfer subunit